MRLARLAGSALIALLMSSVMLAQIPNFSGKWTLDGSESKNTVTVQGNTIDTSMTFDGNPVNVSMTMWLDPSGMLTVQSTRPDFQGGGGPVTTTTTYKKS